MPTLDGEHRRRRDKYDRDARPSPRSKTSYRSPTRTSSLDHGSRSSSSPRKSSTSAFSATQIPELQRRTSSGSAVEQRVAIPYPNFSKAHSKESVRSADDLTPKPALFTPEATDLGHGKGSTDAYTPRSHQRGVSPQAPPSPPLTAMEEGVGRSGSAASLRHASRSPRTGGSSNGSRTREEEGLRFSASRSSLRQAEEGLNKLRPQERVRSTLTPGNSPTRRVSTSRHSSGSTHSDATTVAPLLGQQQRPQIHLRTSKSGQGSENGFTGTSFDMKRSAPIEIFTSVESGSDDKTDITPFSTWIQSSPLPPPPPVVAHLEIPRVDYLLQNGGLPRIVPKSFTPVFPSPSAPNQNRYVSPLLQTQPNTDVRSCFGPFHNLLDDFSNVINKHGSLAVATGYKSIARKRLEQLEHVFARNVSSSSCLCVMCRSSQSARDNSADTWSEVIDLVSRQRQLPQWPPFVLVTPEAGLGLTSIDVEAPMQRLDIDVPDEYREHYIRQSKKTKLAVQNWLESQPEDHASPPSEVDDETLVFAMVTYLAQNQRSTFMALMKGLSTLPPSRAPTPIAQEPKSDLIPQTGIALQRLYRLPRPPRDPETAMFLLKNPSLHHTLATLAAMTAQEWEALTSGRFDNLVPTTTLPTRTPSRAAAAATPTDSEAELAALAEIERSIYHGMESLEDAFEALHSKAEAVRRALRDRAAGLAVAAAAAAAAAASTAGVKLEARLGTPVDVYGGGGGGCARGDRGGEYAGAEEEGGGDEGVVSDVVSELAPDDSASNVGFRERHRRRREKEKGGGGGGAREEYTTSAGTSKKRNLLGRWVDRGGGGGGEREKGGERERERGDRGERERDRDRRTPVVMVVEEDEG